MAITWTNETRKLSDLQPWPRNPRQIRQKQAERLIDSVDTFGQVETLAVGPNGEVYNGHQRLQVLMQEHGADFEVDVRVASRPLTEKEREKLTIYLHKGAAGEWDFDTLANEFEVDELLDWGFEAFELGIGDEVTDPNEEWVGMPEFDHEDLTPNQSVIVHFANKEDRERFSSLVDQTITDSTRSIWFPKAQIDSYANKQYREEN